MKIKFPFTLEPGMRRVYRKYLSYFANEIYRIWDDAQHFETKSALDVIKAIITNAIQRTEEAFKGIHEIAGSYGFATLGGTPSQFPTYVLNAWIRRGSGWITKLTEEQHKLLDRLIAHYTAQEIVGPDELARKIRPYIGLTERQAGKLIKMEATLKNELPPDRLRKILEREAKKMLRYRSTVIARTELNYAYTHGAILQMQDIAERERLEVYKIWLTTVDDKLCDRCSPLDGTRVKLDESFGEVDAPPLHPNCRCSIIFDVA
jgi:SPP1 gp7 family putative phage head morphogenesis protein